MEEINRETSEISCFFNKLESSSCFGRVLVSLNPIVSKEYDSPKVMLKKELFNIYNKFQTYKVKFDRAYGLVTEKYFEFYEDEHLETLLLRFEREEIDIVILGIRTLTKPEKERKLEDEEPKKTVIKRRGRVFADLSDRKLQAIKEEKSDDENQGNLDNIDSNNS